jgi:MYXO-CTERM domain-containing protein
MGRKQSAKKRLQGAGLRINAGPDGVRVASVGFGSSAEKAGLQAGWLVRSVSVPVDRPSKEWMFILALLLLGGVVVLQRRRARLIKK